MLKRLLIVMAVICLPVEAYAAYYTFHGKIKRVRSHDLSTFQRDTDWFTVEGFTSAGNCKLTGADVLMKIADGERGKRQMAMILLAYTTNKTILVNVDDNLTDAGGWCYLRHIDLY